MAGLSSEFFKTPTPGTTDLGKHQFVINPDHVEKFTAIELANRLGNFKVEKSPDANEWNLISPRNLHANQEVVDKIVAALSSLKIRRIYSNDTINISNYSLDTPLMRIKMWNSNDQNGFQELSIGLINPINESTYVTFDKRPVIYQIQNFTEGLEKLNLPDFVDSRMFAFNTSDVAELNLYAGTKEKGQLRISFSYDDKARWLNSEKTPLDPSKIHEYLEELKAIKSLFILDKISAELEEQLKAHVNNPSFQMIIKTKSGPEITYNISKIVGELPGIKVEKMKSFILNASNRKPTFLVDKSFIRLFQGTSKDFKPLTIKKLFY